MIDRSSYVRMLGVLLRPCLYLMRLSRVRFNSGLGDPLRRRGDRGYTEQLL